VFCGATLQPSIPVDASNKPTLGGRSPNGGARQIQWDWLGRLVCVFVVLLVFALTEVIGRAAGLSPIIANLLAIGIGLCTAAGLERNTVDNRRMK
jgi:hypothetical protein